MFLPLLLTQVFTISGALTILLGFFGALNFDSFVMLSANFWHTVFLKQNKQLIWNGEQIVCCS